MFGCMEEFDARTRQEMYGMLIFVRSDQLHKAFAWTLLEAFSNVVVFDFIQGFQ